MPRDPFEVLGLARNACKREIKKRYRLLSKQFHPDLNNDPEAEARFKEIQWAYETLSGKQSQEDGIDSTARTRANTRPILLTGRKNLLAAFSGP